MFLSSSSFFPSLTYVNSYTGEKRTQRLFTFVFECVADRPPWGGGNNMCSMNFLTIFALWEPEEFTEPSAWGQILHRDHWHSWTALDDWRLVNCPSSNSEVLVRWKSHWISIHVNSPTLCESTLFKNLLLHFPHRSELAREALQEHGVDWPSVLMTSSTPRGTFLNMPGHSLGSGDSVTCSGLARR